MNLLVGTSGFSYKEWKGTFYPEKTPAKNMLAYYATQLPAVEINSTFYRLPNVKTLDTWATQVPESFRFAIKASRRITHFRRLKDADEEVGYLLKTCTTLGARLGLVFFQLPPNLPQDNEEMTVIGLGYETENGRFSDVLNKVNVNIVNFDTCNDVYGRLDEDIMLCAGSGTAGRDSCT